jgi:hypothetical protein
MNMTTAWAMNVVINNQIGKSTRARVWITFQMRAMKKVHKIIFRAPVKALIFSRALYQWQPTMCNTRVTLIVKTRNVNMGIYPVNPVLKDKLSPISPSFSCSTASLMTSECHSSPFRGRSTTSVTPNVSSIHWNGLGQSWSTDIGFLRHDATENWAHWSRDVKMISKSHHPSTCKSMKFQQASM